MRHLIAANKGFGRLVKTQLTAMLTKLHCHGYDLDFYMGGKDCLVCTQSGEQFPAECTMVELIDQVYSYTTGNFKYIHTVETTCGLKGIMMMEGIYCLRRRPVITAHYEDMITSKVLSGY